MTLFLYWAFADINWSDLWNMLQNMSIVWVLAILFTTLLTLLVRGWRWKILMHSFAPQITTLDAATALSICYAANLVVPRSGEAVRALSLYWSRGSPISSVMGTVIIERILDMFWLIALVGMAIFFMQERIAQAFPWLARSTMATLAVFIGILILLIGLIYNRQWTLNQINRQLSRFSQPFAQRITNHIEAFFNGLSSIHSPSVYLKILLSSLLLNTLYILIIYESFASFSFISQYHLDFSDALVIMSISSIGMIIPTPGGAGTYHLFFKQALILLYGIPTEPALACATVVHGLATLLYLFLGGPALYLQRRTYQRRRV